jgi:hypothetical protein
MASHALAAYGIYPDRVAINDVIKILNHGGFHNEDICMMLSPTHPIASQVREANVLDTERKASNEGLIDWLGKIGAVVIPTVGFFVRSREFFHAVMPEKEPMNRRGSTLMGLGFSERDADHVESRMRDVGALLYVSCPESEKSRCALELLRNTGAQEAGTLGDLQAFSANA